MATTAETVPDSTPDLQTWMGELQASSGARWYALERTLPTYHDEIAATGFLEDLTQPTNEASILKKWGGGTYKMIAKGVGKGRGKKTLDTMTFDLSGPPRAYPGAEGKPVLFPSAVAPDEEDEEEDDDEDDDPPYAPRGRIERLDRRREPPMPPPWRRDPYDDPVRQLREAAAARNATNSSTDAMKLLNEANANAQSTLAQQLASRDKEATVLREAIMARDDRAEKPYQQAVAAFQTRMEEQRNDFTAQITALRLSSDQQIASMRLIHDQQMQAARQGSEQQITLLSQRHEGELRSLASRQDSEIKTLQREIDRAKEDAVARVREASEAGNRRVQEIKDLLAAQYETRIALLQSERDQALRRADDTRLLSEKDTTTRLSDERRTSEQRESLIKTMLEGREAMQVTSMTNEVNRLRDENAKMQLELSEARKASDPQTSLRNVAAMAETMKTLGLAGPVGGGTPEEVIPEDAIGKAGYYLPRVLGAMEPILRQGADARRAQVRLAEQQIAADLQAKREAIHAASQRRQLPQQRAEAPRVAPPPVAPVAPVAVTVDSGLPELIGSLDSAFSANMPADQVAGLVRAHLDGGGSAETKEALEGLLARPSDEVANELSSAAEQLGHTGLATPRGTLWLESVHRALAP